MTLVTPIDADIETLYRNLLTAWNERQPAVYAGYFDTECQVIGFDGSQMSGPAEIEAALTGIFEHHMTSAYVAKVREVRALGPDSALLRAAAGLLPRGATAINPAVNSHQTLVAVRRGAAWRIALFQNTPAQFHGRPDLAQALTDELQALVAG